MRKKCAAREHNMGTGTEETSENDCVVLGLFTSIYHLLLAVFLVDLLNVPVECIWHVQRRNVLKIQETCIIKMDIQN